MSEEHADNEERDRSSGIGQWLFVVVLMILIAYPLSLGPAVWIAKRVPRSQPFVMVMYLQLESVVEDGPLEPFLESYAEFWYDL